MEKVDKDSISIRSYKIIKNLILSKEITGKIAQEEIADKLGISRTPVILALNKLQSEGYLDFTPYKGFSIKKYSKNEFLELKELRLLFEKYGVEKLIMNLSEKDIKILNDFIDKFKKYYIKKDVGRYRDLDIDFHNFIISKTENRYIIKEYKDYIAVPNVSVGFIPIDISIIHHTDLVNSIISKDIKKSHELITKHLEQLALNDN